LKVSANVRIAMQYFENFVGGKCPPGCAPAYHAYEFFFLHGLKLRDFL